MRIFLLLLLSVCYLQAATPYITPRGIPNPAGYLGFDIKRETPAHPASWYAGTPSATAGYYYIDNTHPLAVNGTNTYGHPGLPRSKWPEGDVTGAKLIYVNAGVYDAIGSAGDRYDWFGKGTAENPIWIAGNPIIYPTIREYVHIGAGLGDTEYFVLENFAMNQSRVGKIAVHPSANGYHISKVLIRNMAMEGTQEKENGTGIKVGDSQTTDLFPDSTINDVVVYNVNVSKFGSYSTDRCGFMKGMHTDRTWVLDSVFFENGADGIAGSHYSNYTTRQSKNYYIGRNVSYQNGENSIDLKAIQGAIVSENIFYGPYNREGGGNSVFHPGASPPFRCKNVSILFNTFYHAAGGVSTGLSDGTDGDFNIIGNIFYDIDQTLGVTRSQQGGSAVQYGGSLGTIRIANNVFYDCHGSIQLSEVPVGGAAYIYGNIFAARKTKPTLNDTTSQQAPVYRWSFEVKQAGDVSRIFSDYNNFDETTAFMVGGVTRDLAYMRSLGWELNSTTNAHGMLDPENGDFALSPDSPLIDAGGTTTHNAYNAVFLLTGENIEYDIAGTFRPQGFGWDIGPYEYDESNTLTIPDQPGAPELTQRHGMITANWGAVYGATGYKLWVSEDGENYNVYVTTSGITAPYPCKNLTTYYFKVGAINAAGSSSLSPPVSIQAQPHPANAKRNRGR